MNARADSRVLCRSSCDSPRTRSRNCRAVNEATSRQEKNLRAASPLAKWKIDAPIIIVLSTSKNAAPYGSTGTATRSGTGGVSARARTRPGYRRGVNARCRQKRLSGKQLMQADAAGPDADQAQVQAAAA